MGAHARGRPVAAHEVRLAHDRRRAGQGRRPQAGARRRPLADWPPTEPARRVLFAIADTLPTDGRLTAAAYAALERWHAARYRLVAVTGRPAGWCDHIARVWPVDAVIGENGAFYFCRDHSAQKLIKRFHDDAATRAANRAR